ncbi:coproporphyrinogen III oxidase [Desmospora profundinema]|uniref:Oxygen-independent coproporphyrinogen-3 oxidase n=1 Tax=Desmospora profundinema TaxID=1571184 RepID=A0ABU1IN56_9BACL|nr:coproporphyrinogen III oxidase [Desmospora profundinema]MDR6225220.1 oxygen-independent coproporphyrinogen-3 oxidase [Desmospora profundinema]
MKRLQVSGVSPAFHRDIELIAGLFYPGVKVTEDREEMDASVHFTVEETEWVNVSVTLAVPSREQAWHGSHRREHVSAVLDERTRRKRVKPVVNHALLQVLEEATGVRQPWGILTGVRPTKLMHNLLLEGKSVLEARNVLERDYRLAPHKLDLLEEIMNRQITVLPDLYQLDREVSLYVGIPFCPTKCAYCTFPAYAIRGRNGSVEEFLEGLHKEIEATGKWLKKRGLPVTTIYFGGGTPTSITAAQLEALFERMKACIPGFDQVRELTVEAGRPDTLEQEKLDLLKRWKVDRISINPQSFKEETLKLIGRHHTVKETVEKFALARKMGLNNINMDLIIGLPGEGLETFRQSLRVMESLHPESLTVHTLSFKRGSHMTRNPEKYPVADGEEIASMVAEAREWTGEQGYVPYYLYRQKNILGNQENVGYALPGEESLYNIIIMEERQTIIGLGCGAVSKIISPGSGRIRRWPNPKEPQAYIDTYREQIGQKLAALDQAYGYPVESKG